MAIRKNIVTNKAGRDPVEFAVKLPGGDDGEVFLPIDSKYPYTIYTDMQTAYEQNNFEEYDWINCLVLELVL